MLLKISFSVLLTMILSTAGFAKEAALYPENVERSVGAGLEAGIDGLKDRSNCESCNRKHNLDRSENPVANEQTVAAALGDGSDSKSSPASSAKEAR